MRQGIHPASPSPAGYDLTTAEGYAAWRASGGRWPSETSEVMRRYRVAEVASMERGIDWSVANMAARDGAMSEVANG